MLLWCLLKLVPSSSVVSRRVYSKIDPKTMPMLLQHPLHVFLFDAFTPLMNCCRALGDAGEAIRVCRNIITSLEKVVPGSSLELANFYFCLGEMYMERADESSTSQAIAKRYRKQVCCFEPLEVSKT